MTDFFLFSGTSNLPLAQKVAKKLNIKLGKIEIKRFADGECRVRIEENIKGKTVYLLQSLSVSEDENLFELCLMVDSAKRLGAKEIIAIIPWLGYSKQDKEFRRGESVSGEVIAKILTSAGLSQIIVFDLHSPKIKKFYKIPIRQLSAKKILAKKIKQFKNKLVISPDKGGRGRAEAFAKDNSLPIVYLKKERNLITGKITYEKLSRDLKSKTAIIFDDIINTGGTIIKSAQLLKKNKAGKIIVLATHAVLAGNAPQKLQNCPVDKIFLSDTINIPKNRQFPKLETFSIADILAQTLKT